MTEHGSQAETKTASAAANSELADTAMDQEMLRVLTVQCSLTVGSVDDPLEDEAEAMADTIMRMPDPFIQRKCTACEEEETVQRKPISSFIQRKEAGGSVVASDAVTAGISSTRGNGQSLDTGTRSFMESRFGADFGNVNVHTGHDAIQMNRQLNAQAFTVGNDVYFNSGKFSPGTNEGRHLLAHELTHTIQQSGRIDKKIQKSPLSESYERLWNTTHSKGRIFDLLRSNPAGRNCDADTVLCLGRIFAGQPDDIWLGEQLCTYGPEPFWPGDIISERAARANNPDHPWARESGNIAGDFRVNATETIHAYFFPGSTQRRAMIIGGVHGSEAAGVEVVDILLRRLRDPLAPLPVFSVVVVPTIFPANLANRVRETPGQVDPNRQMPAIGTDLTHSTTLNCDVDSQGRCVEENNRILINLVNRFDPERIASVHGHSISNDQAVLLRNGGASITSDARPGSEIADRNLALEMARRAHALGVNVPANFIGTPNETAVYPTGTAVRSVNGITFGGWGSHSTPSRPAMNVVLIETYGNKTSTESRDPRTRRIELENLASVLQDIFLVRN